MNQRITWAQLPEEVRAGVEEILGESVVETKSQQGGFSPGTADRVLLASGRRAFVKAVSAEVNASSVELHRQEAAITAALPAGVPAPGFLGMYDDGTWVALALADVAGRHPLEPWVDAELEQVLDALVDVGQVLLPADLDVPHYDESLRGAFMGWDKLQKRPLDALDPWAGERLDLLAQLAHDGVDALAGSSLVHGDLRTDNILLTGQGAVLVDWPWAAIGASWADALGVLINVKTLNTGADSDSNVEHWLTSHPVFSGAAPDAVTGVLAGWTGYFLDMSRRSAPPGIPTLRAFQRKQADVLIAWLKERLSRTSRRS